MKESLDQIASNIKQGQEILSSKFCEINKIVVKDKNVSHELFIAQIKDGDIGCLDAKGNKIIKFKYDIIKPLDNLLECGRNGSFDIFDSCGNRVDTYTGIFDLYDLSGKMLIGGYTKRDINPDGLSYFFFEDYNVLAEWYKYYFYTKLHKESYSINYCISLVLNERFESVISGSNGDKFVPSLQRHPSYIEKFPISVFLPGKVLCCEFDLPYILSRVGETALESDYTPTRFAMIDNLKSFYRDYRDDDEDDWEYEDDDEEEDEEEIDTDKDVDEEEYKEEDLVDKPKYCVTHLNEKGVADWHSFIDEHYYEFVRVGSRVGVLGKRGIKLSEYNAICKNKNIVAQTIKLDTIRDIDLHNPNFYDGGRCLKLLTRFFEIRKDGTLHKLEDNWDVFDPNSVSWFPKDFLEENGISADDWVWDDGYDDGHTGWSQKDIADAYMSALENDLSNEWNFD